MSRLIDELRRSLAGLLWRWASNVHTEETYQMGEALTRIIWDRGLRMLAVHAYRDPNATWTSFDSLVETALDRAKDDAVGEYVVVKDLQRG